jgi:3-hydroxyisobutyrate dehydrogenase-like beta-hydroxyacid dehydrogenase
MGPVSWPFGTADSRRTAVRIAVLNLILALFLAVASLAFLSADFNGTKPERLKKFVRNRAEFGWDWNKAKEWLNSRFTIYAATEETSLVLSLTAALAAKPRR